MSETSLPSDSVARAGVKVEELVAERHGPVLVCRFNRPDSLNGLTGPLVGEFLALLADARVDDSVRVVVTTGEGKAYSAGGDVHNLASESAKRGLNALMHENLKPTSALALADRTFDRLGIGRETLAIRNFDKPLIAAINGAAAGGGLAVALLHDIRLASERSKFSTAFIRIGLVAEMGLSYTLPRAVGFDLAADMLFTGRQVDAQEAKASGLVTRVVAHDDLMDEAITYAQHIAAMPPIAIQYAKRALTRSFDNTFAAQLDLEWPYQVAAFDTQDCREGVAAFVERRPPRFTGQ